MSSSPSPSSPCLFLARAAWDYASGVPTELSFAAGDLLEVSEEVSDTWWRGRRQGDPSGPALLFPVIYAEREPDEPALLDEAAAALPLSAAGGAVAVAAGHARSYRQTLSLHSSERIVRVEIPDAERKITGGVLHSWFSVQLQTSRRTVLCEKRFHEFCQAELQLRALFSARMASVPTLSASARPDLYVKKRTARTLEARRLAAEALLQATVVDEAAGTLLLTFFLGSDSEVVAVPAFVPASPRAEASKEGSGIGAEAAGSSAATASESVAPAVLAEAPWPEPASADASAAPFSLDDMDAFDALLNTGVAVVAGDLVGVPLGFGVRGDGSGAVAIAPRDGQRVRLGLASFVWDGSSSAVRPLMHAPRCELTLGDCRDERLPVGLHAALRALPCPCAGPVTAIVGPRLAFGDAGQPPAVPAAANIVFVLLIEGVEGSPRSMAAFARAPPPPGLTLGSAAGAPGGAAAAPPDDGRLRVVLASEPPPAAAPPPRPPGETLLGRPALAAPTLAAGVPLPPGTIISSSGHIMPSVDAAERAMRAYLASIGQDVPPPPPPPPAASRSARTSAAGGTGGGGLMQKLFGGGGAAAASSALPAADASPPAAAAASDGGGGIFKRLFTGGGTMRRPSGSEAAGGDAAAAAAAAAGGAAGTDPAGGAARGRWGGGGHVRSATDGGGIRAGGKPSSLAAARLQAQAAASSDAPAVTSGPAAASSGKPPLLRAGSQP